MQVFYSVTEVQNYLSLNNSKSIGFVPTMGALHDAHMSLVNFSKSENDITICSIFVNPKQFNKKEDLVKYPRNIEADLISLKSENCDIVFVPSVEEMYPKKVEKKFYFNTLSEVMEAECRPGHFNGVAIVIERFFEILSPTRAYFGEKDYQQLAVVKSLAKQINSPVKIIGCELFREPNGLAMSSRNERLTDTEKEESSLISRSLKYVCENKHLPVSELKKYFLSQISKYPHFEIEYFEIANETTLEPITEWGDSSHYIAFAAVNVSGVRLIDNMKIIN